MNSTFSRKFTFCVFSTFSKRNFLFSALPITTTIIHGRKLILLTGPSHPYISTNLTISKPRDVCTKSFSIFLSFLTAKLLYNNCYEFRTYISATSQLIKHIPHIIKPVYLPVTNLVHYVSAVVILKIQNFVSNFSNPLRITFPDTLVPSTHPTDIDNNNNNDNAQVNNSNNITHTNNNNDTHINSSNNLNSNHNYKQNNTTLYSILSSYLPKLPTHYFTKKHVIPDLTPILLPSIKYIPSPAPRSSNYSATRDPQVLENTLRNAANNGNISAGFNLGMMYTNGTAVRQEKQLAHKYFKAGSYRGDNSSKLMSILLILKLKLTTPNPRVVNQ